jgi:hypothetical protein
MKKGFLLVTFILCLSVPSIASERSEIPFGPGEKLTYKLYWTFVHAGDAVLEVMPDTLLKGVPARHFRATAKTVPWVDRFYKVRDTVDSWTNMDVTHSLRYKKDQNEGSYHKKVDLVFNKKADISLRWARGKLQHILQQPKDAFDPMSILFSFRRIRLHEGMHFVANVTDGKKTVVGEASVGKVEDVKTPMGVIRTYLVNMDIKHLSGVFKKSKNAELMVWFSADERRIPVKVKSKVAVGYFTLELVKYQPSL